MALQEIILFHKKALRANKENKEKFQKIKDELILKNKKVVDQSKEVLKKLKIKKLSSLEMQVITVNFMVQFLLRIFQIILMRKK